MWEINPWEVLGLAIDSAVIYIFYRVYKSRTKDADLLQATDSYDVGAELYTALASTDNKVLDYVGVNGVVTSVGSPLKSNYTSTEGVIQHSTFIEHKSKRTQGFWTDMKHVIKDQTLNRQFALVNEDRELGAGHRLEVMDPLSAEYLTLTITHDHYEPSKDGAFARGLDRIFGEVTKGYQETESMLPVGVPLLGIGKVSLEAGRRILLSPPQDGRKYILTGLTKTELVRMLRSDARMFKILLWVFGLLGAVAAGYVIYRNLQRIMSLAQTRRFLDELRLRRRADANGVVDTEREEVACVVCLTRPREVVILDCGHICVCGECAMQLPSPKRCPVCRGEIVRLVPTYVA